MATTKQIDELKVFISHTVARYQAAVRSPLEDREILRSLIPPDDLAYTDRVYAEYRMAARSSYPPVMVYPSPRWPDVTLTFPGQYMFHHIAETAFPDTVAPVELPAVVSDYIEALHAGWRFEALMYGFLGTHSHMPLPHMRALFPAIDVILEGVSYPAAAAPKTHAALGTKFREIAFECFSMARAIALLDTPAPKSWDLILTGIRSPREYYDINVNPPYSTGDRFEHLGRRAYQDTGEVSLGGEDVAGDRDTYGNDEGADYGRQV
jgi:hypothetical protein